jgi:membrane protease YdiL (CAAX protease family)
VLLAPVAEELLFRGIFLNLLLRWLKNPHAAIAIQALVFVAFHSLSWPIDFTAGVAMAQRFIDACLFAYARRHTDSIFVPIAMHMTGNLVSVVEQLI